MNDHRDRYMENALREEFSGEHAPDLSERILASATRLGQAAPSRARSARSGRRAPLAPARSRSLAGPVAAVLLLALAALVVAVAFNAERAKPKDTAEARQNLPAPQPRNEAPAEPQPAPQTPKKEEPKPSEPANEESRPPVNTPRNEDVRKPEQVPPKEEAKEPEPEKPKEEVKKPEESTPPKPEEKPAPPAPRQAVVFAEVKELPRKNALKFRYGEAEAWRNAEVGEKLLAGAMLSSNAPIDLPLAAGGLLRFSGELSFEQGDALVVAIKDDAAYIDNLDAPAVTFKCAALSASVVGIALFDPGRSALQITCFQGEVKTAHGTLDAGFSAALTAKGLSKAHRANLGALSGSHAILRSLPRRLLLREDFESLPKERLDKGAMKNGLASAEGNEAGVSFYLAENMVLRPGMTLRARCRINRSVDEFLLQVGTESKGNYRLLQKPGKAGEWFEIEFELAEMVRTLERSEPIRPGAQLRFIQLWANAPQGCTLEVDWVEIARRPADG